MPLDKAQSSTVADSIKKYIKKSLSQLPLKYLTATSIPAIIITVWILKENLNKESFDDIGDYDVLTHIPSQILGLWSNVNTIKCHIVYKI